VKRNKPNTLVRVPRRWSSHQADAIVRLLDELAEAIWNVHGDAILELRMARASDENRCRDQISTD
jgi:hypothetical protein